MITEASLKPGDCLVYAPTGVFGWIIAIKTWHWIAHTETYIGNGQSVASRDGLGVDIYPTRFAQLAYVLTPNQPFSLESSMDWFATVDGQGYDWLGLLRFAWRSRVVPTQREMNKQFCSEFTTRFYRKGGIDPFNKADADSIAPFQFLLSPYFDTYRINPE